VTPIADISTSDGITTVALNATARLPVIVPTVNGNAFYRKVVASSERVILFDGSGFADIYTPALHHTGSIRGAGMIDLAASAKGTYALFSNRAIASYSIDGTPISQTSLNETTDIVPLSINTATNAVWVTFSRGCTSGACEKRTNIYNASLSQTASLNGGAIDVTVSGNRAYALFDLPAEVRTYDITDPQHPVQLASRAVEGSVAPLSLAFASGTLYVLGEKLYAYDAATLAKSGEQFPSYVADPTSPVSAADQRVRADGSCAVVTGRAFDASLYSIASPSSWTAAPPTLAPSPARALAQQSGVFYVLTDHSLEVWSTKPMPSLPRRHAAR